MKEKNILIELANLNDIDEIVSLKQKIYDEMDNKEWYFIDSTDKTYLENLLNEEKGFILKATYNKKIIGFLIIILKLKNDSNIITYSNLKDKVNYCAELGNGAVAKEYRGKRLLQKMILEAEKLIKNNNYRYILSTVHPDNKASLNSQLNLGYKILCHKKMYGDKDRNILIKRLKEVFIPYYEDSIKRNYDKLYILDGNETLEDILKKDGII